ncbi:MAG: leucine-rich repeat domain-containing protein [Chitinispirillaceae bacterium]|nr:leucine-rich repeat domain-containing protein [Chitinispirillaceae bacterium]
MRRNTFFFIMALLTGSAIAVSGQSDALIVQRILERCGMRDISVEEVTEMEDGRVVKLDLSNNDVAKDGITLIPDEIGKLTALREFVCTDNSIEEVPSEIGRCVNLRKLDLGSNRIGLLPNEIGQLRQLEKLDLRHNRLTALPPELANCKNIEYLWLWGNKLTDIKPVAHLTNLQELYLKDNRLTMLPPSIMRIKFRYIDFLGNRLCNLPSRVDNWVKTIDNRYRATQRCQ